MPNYQNGKIYILKCELTNKKYVGSTCNPLNRRLSEHKYAIKIQKKMSINDFINPSIELLENYPCNSSKELKEREQFYISNTNCINKVSAFTDRKEYLLKTQDKRNERSIEFYYKNKELINKRNSEKIKCECGCMIRRGDISSHRKTKKHNHLLDLL